MKVFEQTIQKYERELRSPEDDILLPLASLTILYDRLNVAMSKSVDTIYPCALLPGKRKPNNIAIVTATMVMITVEMAQQIPKTQLI